MNEALRNALAAKGIDRLDIATNLQVDPKTVERWLAGRLPHPTSRAAIAKLLSMDEGELWPAAKDPHARHFGPEIRAVYPHRSAVPHDAWRALLADAEHEIDVLDHSGSPLFENASLLQLFVTKAGEGIRIRILLSDPDSPSALQGGDDENIGLAAADHIRTAHAVLKPIAALDGVELRFHQMAIYNAIYRADDRLLAIPHIYGMPASAAPVLNLRRSAGAVLFSAYLDSFEQAWRG